MPEKDAIKTQGRCAQVGGAVVGRRPVHDPGGRTLSSRTTSAAYQVSRERTERLAIQVYMHKRGAAQAASAVSAP